MEKGWNISKRNLKEIFDFIDSMNPQDEIEERNKYILHLAFVENKSALTISKMNDAKIVGYGNRDRGKPLTNNSISRIIKSYNLVNEKEHDFSQRNNYHRRKTLTIKRQRGEIKKPLICGCCGNKQELELHHIVPLELGGTDDFYNLIYLCKDCHKRMHKNILDSLSVAGDSK